MNKKEKIIANIKEQYDNYARRHNSKYDWEEVEGLLENNLYIKGNEGYQFHINDDASESFSELDDKECNDTKSRLRSIASFLASGYYLFRNELVLIERRK